LQEVTKLSGEQNSHYIDMQAEIKQVVSLPS